jgi:hypothetical protein
VIFIGFSYGFALGHGPTGLKYAPHRQARFRKFFFRLGALGTGVAPGILGVGGCGALKIPENFFWHDPFKFQKIFSALSNSRKFFRPFQIPENFFR